jgi:hypothetical protein
MSVRHPTAPKAANPLQMESNAQSLGASDVAATADSLAEGNGFSTAHAEHPLKRTVHVSINTTLSDLMMNPSKGVWAPSNDALKAIFQQSKFTGLDGKSEAFGDLRSVVLHSLTVNEVASNFPIALGAKISGVDNSTFSHIGTPFSTIVNPETTSTRVRHLQKDDVSLCYEFAKKFPGYTSENLDIKGIHKVDARRFVLVSADHPIVSAVRYLP